MYEDIVKSLNREIARLLADKQEPGRKFEMAAELSDRVKRQLPKGSPEQGRLLALVYEIMGNLKFSMKEPQEAEKYYQTMVITAEKLYQKEPKEFDLLLAQTNLRMAVFYKNLIKINTVQQPIRSLNETEQKVYDASERFFKNAVRACLDKIKAGQKAAVELQGKCMGNLMVLKGTVGKYEEAIELGEQLIALEKAVFASKDDAPHAAELAQWMNALASIYTVHKDYEKAMEIMEDCVYALEDKEKDSPIDLGIRLSTSYANLGNACFLIPEEQEHAEEAYLKGLTKIQQLNQQTDGRFTRDEAQMCVIIGNYYMQTGQKEKAQEYLSRGKQ